MKKKLNKRSILKTTIMIASIFGIIIGTNININVVEATTSMPEEAKPIHKGGFVFGGSHLDILGDAGATNKNGITVATVRTYALDGDYNLQYNFNTMHSAAVLINPEGQFIKAVKFDKTLEQTDIHVVITDQNGDFYLSGYDYSSMVNYPNSKPGIAPYETEPKSAWANAFIVKIDQEGNILWYTILDGTGNERVTGLGFDSSGNIVFSGYTNSPVADSPYVGENNGKHDVIVGKLSSSDGSIVKAPKFFGGSGDEVTAGTYDVVNRDFSLKQEMVLKNGNYYITFKTNSPISGDISERISRGTDYDIGIMQFDEDLNLVKYKSFGGNGDEEANSLMITLGDKIFMPFNSKSTNLRPELAEAKGGKDIKYMELDLDLNYTSGGVIGGTGDEILRGYQLLPSGDIILTGATTSTDGDYSDRTSSDPAGFISYYDTNTQQLKSNKYYGNGIGRYVYRNNGDFLLIGTTNTKVGMGEMDGTLKGQDDLFAAKFGPTASTPSFITAKDHANVRQRSGVVDARAALGAAIGDYDSYVTQDDLIVTPATIPTDEIKSHKVILSSTDATPVTSYIHVTQNENPIISGNQVFDSGGDFTISAGSDLTAAQLITMNKISAWNFETNEKYNVTVDAADLALVNAVTTTTTTVPVKVSSKNGNNETVTKTINIQVMSQAAAVSEIEAAAVAAWGGDQSEFVTLANFTISIGAKNVSEILNDIRNTSYTSAQAIAVLNRSLIDVDRDKNGKTDYNIDINKDGVADINVDTNKDGTVDVNLVQSTSKSGMNYDKNGDGYPDTNIDIDGNGTAELNIDIDGNGTADIEIDLNFDGVADLNLDTNSDQVADVNVDINNDGVADINIDTNNDNIADINIDVNNDMKADINIDINADRIADLNIDTDNDGKPNVNLAIYKSGEADFNIDTDNDGIADGNLVQSSDLAGLNYDKNGNGYPDINIDVNGDGVADINIDTNGDGVADINIDTNGDGIADINIDTNGDGIADTNIETVSEKQTSNNKLISTGMSSNSTILLSLFAIVMLMIKLKRKI